MGLISLQKETLESSVYSPTDWSLEEHSHQYSVTLVSSSLASRTIRNKLLLFIRHPVCGTLLEQLELTKTFSDQVFPSVYEDLNAFRNNLPTTSPGVCILQIDSFCFSCSKMCMIRSIWLEVERHVAKYKKVPSIIMTTSISQWNKSLFLLLINYQYVNIGKK